MARFILCNYIERMMSSSLSSKWCLCDLPSLSLSVSVSVQFAPPPCFLWWCCPSVDWLNRACVHTSSYWLGSVNSAAFQFKCIMGALCRCTIWRNLLNGSNAILISGTSPSRLKVDRHEWRCARTRRGSASDSKRDESAVCREPRG